MCVSEFQYVSVHEAFRKSIGINDLKYLLLYWILSLSLTHSFTLLLCVCRTFLCVFHVFIVFSFISFRASAIKIEFHSSLSIEFKRHTNIYHLVYLKRMKFYAHSSLTFLLLHIQFQVSTDSVRIVSLTLTHTLFVHVCMGVILNFFSIARYSMLSLSLSTSIPFSLDAHHFYLYITLFMLRKHLKLHTIDFVICIDELRMHQIHWMKGHYISVHILVIVCVSLWISFSACHSFFFHCCCCYTFTPY